MSYSVFHYPLVIRQVDEWLVLSIPDLKVSIVEKAPAGKIDPKFLFNLSKGIGKLYLKGYDILKNYRHSNKKPPQPSYIKGSTSVHDDIITVKDVAEILGWSEMTVRRRTDDGTLPHFFVGSHRKYRKSLIDHFAEIKT